LLLPELVDCEVLVSLGNDAALGAGGLSWGLVRTMLCLVLDL
jgi:hypothetical protein